METTTHRPGASAGPLAGLRALELGSLVAGPFCGSLLGDFGADVIKIEQVEGDPVRAMGERVDGKSLFAASLMRNKRLVSIDLRTEKGRAIVREIAAGVDIVVENFRPGVLEKWGLDYHSLRALNPKVVMVRISGFGQDGPYRSRPGYGAIGEAVSGLRHLIGDPDRPPARAALPLTDYLAGLYGALGALLAIIHRDRTGEGQYVDAALYEAAFSLLRSEVPAFDKLGTVANRAGSRLPGHVPNNLYQARDGGYIAVSGANDSLFRRLTQVMGRPELADDPRFRGPLERAANEVELDGLIQDWIGRYDLVEVERLLIEAEVVASRIYTVEDIFQDSHFRARDMLVRVPAEEFGDLAMPNVVPKLSASPGRVVHAGGRQGHDTYAVLREFTSLSEEALAGLEQTGVIQQSRPEGAAQKAGA